MHQWKIRPSLLALSFGLLFSLNSMAEESEYSPWEVWRQGYYLYAKGEALQSKGNLEAALEQFRQARACYAELKERRPDWKQSIIDGRINMCDQAIGVIQTTLGKTVPASEPDSVPPAVPAGSPVAVSAGNSALEEELAAYKKRLLEALKELEENRQELRRHQTNRTEIENLIKEKRIAEENYELLLRRYEALEKKLSQPDSEKNEIKNQLINERLNRELLAKRFATFQEDFKKLQEELNGAIQERNQSREAEKNARERVKTLDYENAAQMQKYNDLSKTHGEVSSRLSQVLKELEQLKKLSGEKQAEIDKLNHWFVDAKNGTEGANRINADLFLENQTLREKLDQLRTDTEQQQRDLLLQQDKLRENNLEMEQFRNALKTMNSRHTTVSEENRILNEQYERLQKADAEALEELKTLRETARRQEENLQEWMDKADKLQSRLNSSNDSQYQNALAVDEQNKTLTTELANRRREVETLQAGLTEAKTRQEEAEMLAEEAKKAFIELKASVVSLELAAQKAEPLQREVESLRAVKGQLETLQRELKLANEKLQAQARKQTDLTALQQENQKYAELESRLVLTEQKLQLALNDREQLRKANAALKKQNSQDERVKELETANAKLREQLLQAKVTPEESQPRPAVQPEAPTPEKIAEFLKNGQEAETRGANEVAIWNYRQILAGEPDHFEANLKLGTLYLLQERYGEAAEALQLAVLRDGESLPAVVQLARALNGLEKYGNALALLEKPLQKHPDDYQLLLAVGTALARSNQPQEAEKMLNRAIDREPRDISARRELALVIAENDAARQEEAVRLYQAARELGLPPDARLEELLKDALSDQKETIEFLYQAAAEAENGEDFDSAIWYYEQLCQLDKSGPLPVNKLAFAQLQNGNAELALKTIPRETADPAGLCIAALAELESNQLPAAADLLSLARERNGAQPWMPAEEYQPVADRLADRLAATPPPEQSAEWQRVIEAYQQLIQK